MIEAAQPSNARPMDASKLPLLVILLAILLVAAVLRFHRLGEQSLWYDEGVAYAHSLRSLPELIPLLQRNVHLPAYFALLGWWQDLTGSSEFALRSLSTLFSIVSVAWAYALGQRLFHPIAGVTAAALVALNSFSIYYAQEARMYAMLTAIAGASMWLFIGLLRRLPPPQNRWQAVFALGFINTLGIYTHIAYALVIVTQACLALAWLLFADGNRRRAAGEGMRVLLQFCLANLVTLLLFAPWLPVSMRQIFSQPNLSQPIAADQLLRLLQGTFAFGITFEQFAGNLDFVIVFLLLFGLLPAGGRRSAWNLLLPVAWVLISAGIYLYLGLTTRYLRFLLPAQLAFALWLGRGVWLLWSRQVRHRHIALRKIPKLAAAVALGALLLALFNGLDALYRGSEFQRDDIRDLVAQIEDDLGANNALLVSAAGLQEVLSYYYSSAAPVYALPTSADKERTRSQVREIIAAHQRLHVIFYGAAEQDPNRIVETTLNTEAFEISDAWVDDLRYVQYHSPLPLRKPRQTDLSFGTEITLKSYAPSSETLAAGDALQVQLIWTANTTPNQRYKVFLQLLNADGALVAQRDSEPSAGTNPTTVWPSGAKIVDNHALLIPSDLPAGVYTLIAGLYDVNNANARLPVAGNTFVELRTFIVN